MKRHFKEFGAPEKSEETRRKLSIAHKGKRLSEKAKAQISAAHKGKSLSNEHKQKISLAGRGRMHSDESRAKISRARMGMVFSDEHIRRISEANRRRPKQQYEVNGVSHSLAEWSALLGIKENTLLYRLRRGWSAARTFSLPALLREAA